jgi:hypothetical protein
VDVKENLFTRLTGNAIDLFAGRQQTRTCERSAVGNRHFFRP